jgi:apolipoprotein D and lipocalin family protein
MKILAALATLILVPSLAMAAAPQPAQAVPPGMYAGRWFQIAQILQTDHHPCHEGVDEFVPSAKGGFTIIMTCQGYLGGPRSVSAHGEVTPGSGGAKFKLSFLGGLIRQEYWVLDHAADQSWALMATPGGNFLWLLARKPALSAADHATACARIRALGFDLAKLTPDR